MWGKAWRETATVPTDHVRTSRRASNSTSPPAARRAIPRRPAGWHATRLRRRSVSDAGLRRDTDQASAPIIADELPYFVISCQHCLVFHAKELTLEANAPGLMRIVVVF